MEFRSPAAQVAAIAVLLLQAGVLTALSPQAEAHTAMGQAAARRAAAGRAVPAQVVADRIRAAASGPAPQVTDSGRAGSKTGLQAPVMSRAMLRANAARQAAATAASAASMPAVRNLKATQRLQTRNYFCGPATVAEMLAQVGVTVHQHKAASELGTLTDGGTDWSNSSGYPLPRVLNKNQKRNNYVAVALPWSPTAAQTRKYETDLVSDINHNGGVPLAGNAYEVPGGPHLVGHPAGQTIFHWFDIRGYRESGAITDYEDSVHGAPSIGWSAGVPAYSSLSSRVLVSILGARGYVW